MVAGRSWRQGISGRSGLPLDDDVPVALRVHLEVIGSALVLVGRVRALGSELVNGNIAEGPIGVVDIDLEVAVASGA